MLVVWHSMARHQAIASVQRVLNRDRVALNVDTIEKRHISIRVRKVRRVPTFYPTLGLTSLCKCTVL